MNSKFFSLFFAIILISINTIASPSHYLDENGIVRKADGSVYLMSYFEAMGADKDGNVIGPKICPVGTHIPSLTELTVDMNPAGMSDTKQPGYYVITSFKNGKFIKEFYYSNQSFIRPAGDLGNYDFLSSSVMGNINGYRSNWFFKGTTGFINYWPQAHGGFALRCFLDK